MPELPEVETVRRTLSAMIVGRRVVAVRVRRAGVITGSRAPEALLCGRRIAELRRLGKHLVILPAVEPARDDQALSPDKAGPCLAVHLGMTGSLVVTSVSRADVVDHDKLGKHAHVVWQLDDGRRLVFDDPRRFGGLWTYPDFDTHCRSRWAKLGPDALTIASDHLAAGLAGSQRAIKAALLDQALLAGVGNIYADEALFLAGIDPRQRCGRLKADAIERLARAIRGVLVRAVEAGGSSVRDYVDSGGNPGRFQHDHQVYGRAGQPCTRCRHALSLVRLAGRATVFCRRCQQR